MKFHCEEKPILWGGATASSQYGKEDGDKRWKGYGYARLSSISN